MLYDDYGDGKFYSKEAAQAAGHSIDKGFYTNNKNIVELKSWMFNGWSFSGERAGGPIKEKDTWFFEFYAPWSAIRERHCLNDTTQVWLFCACTFSTGLFLSQGTFPPGHFP